MQCIISVLSCLVNNPCYHFFLAFNIFLWNKSLTNRLTCVYSCYVIITAVQNSLMTTLVVSKLVNVIVVHSGLL